MEGVNIIKGGSFAASTTAKQLPTSPSNGVTPASGAALQGRRAISIANEDSTNTIRVGDANITSGAGGMPIPPKASASIDALAHCPVWVVADAGTPTVSWLEVA